MAICVQGTEAPQTGYCDSCQEQVDPAVHYSKPKAMAQKSGSFAAHVEIPKHC